MFISVNVGSNNRQFLHIDIALLEFLDIRFGGRVRLIERHDEIVP